MKKINIGRVILAGLVAGLAFLFVEIVIEGFFYVLFGISESEMYQEAFDIASKKIPFHILNIAILFVICFLIMWVYAAIRPRFTNNVKAAIASSMLFWGFAFLFIVNHINLGLFPLGTFVGLGFNLIELPAAVLAGSAVYKEN